MVDVVGVVLEVVGALEEVVVDDMVEAVVLEVVGSVEEVVVVEVVEVETVDEVDEVDEAVVVLWTVYPKDIVPLAPFASMATITYVPVTHDEPPTDVV